LFNKTKVVIFLHLEKSNKKFILNTFRIKNIKHKKFQHRNLILWLLLAKTRFSVEKSSNSSSKSQSYCHYIPLGMQVSKESKILKWFSLNLKYCLKIM
jgi:hypothetical protein